MITLRLLTPEEVEELNRRCDERPSPRSSARCEMKPGHLAYDHAGRTRGGYWRFWPSTKGPS